MLLSWWNGLSDKHTDMTPSLLQGGRMTTNTGRYGRSRTCLLLLDGLNVSLKPLAGLLAALLKPLNLEEFPLLPGNCFEPLVHFSQLLPVLGFNCRPVLILDMPQGLHSLHQRLSSGLIHWWLPASQDSLCYLSEPAQLLQYIEPQGDFKHHSTVHNRQQPGFLKTLGVFGTGSSSTQVEHCTMALCKAQRQACMLS